MGNIAIRVDGLSKQYNIGLSKRRHDTLRDEIADGVRSIFRTSGRNSTGDTIWALKDVSFEVKHGEVLGLIGRNGAGKSTLLKILSRITEPTAGRAEIFGRIGSLLEVGTGFHGELTGRENIYLNGAILGMKKWEIDKKFDEIVAFSEIDKFVDTPVKRYSSGMYVRLAFAVAAHLETEVLIIDEVLAVGDVAFQRKCLGKMHEVATGGRTILFVSHQMSAIETLCSRVLMLRSGAIQFAGETKSAIAYYLKDLDSRATGPNINDIKRSGTGDIRLTGFSLEDSAGDPLVAAASGEDLILVFSFEVITNKPLNNVNIGFSIHNNFGETLSIVYSEYNGFTFSGLPKSGKVKGRIKDFPYSVGRYFVGARITVNGVEADMPHGHIGHIDVVAGDFYRTGILARDGVGPVLIRADWQLQAFE
jgi:lipopolysaccharide transport system ATP-binding protein